MFNFLDKLYNLITISYNKLSLNTSSHSANDVIEIIWIFMK